MQATGEADGMCMENLWDRPIAVAKLNKAHL